GSLGNLFRRLFIGAIHSPGYTDFPAPKARIRGRV
ncbi:uncharacterized protein METZ01_LOCUS191077, partial [marine metagenome]